MSTATDTRPATNSALTAGQLPKFSAIGVLILALGLAAGVLALFGMANIGSVLIIGGLLFYVLIFLLSNAVEGVRKARDRVARYLVTSFFLIALIPLVSVVISTVGEGVKRLDGEFFTYSMRNVLGEGGGAVHAIWGTLIITGIASLISVPIGLLTAIYLVEYSRNGRLAAGIRFFVDVMTGIPSIVAGLFAFTVFSLILDPGHKSGFSGAVALSILMIPTVVRSVEEMLRIVPNELREASYALGVPKFRTILKVVLPTALAGIITGVVLAVARVIGETAPLLVTASVHHSLNVNPFSDAMTTLPVFVYNQYMYAPGIDTFAFHERAWAGALTLIAIVMTLNLLGRFISWKFAPKQGR